MKGLDIFCASTASTAICSSTDRRQSMVRRGHRPIDRQNSKPNYAPPSSELPQTPRRSYHGKSRNSSAKPISTDQRRKSAADVLDLYSPPGSSRYLLSDKPFIDLLPPESENNASAILAPAQPEKPKHVSSSCSNDYPARSHHQVVVLRMSIHCKGCEGKVRKHISKMEGVTSFSIDLPTKKVTVIGDVTPSGVLASLSRVKNAQLWPSAALSPSPSSSLVKANY